MHSLPGIPNYPKTQDNLPFLLTVEEIDNPMLVIDNFFDHYTHLQNIRGELEKLFTETLLTEVPNEEPFIVYCFYKDLWQLIEAMYVLKTQLEQQNASRKRSNPKQKQISKEMEKLEIQFLDHLAHELSVQFSSLPTLMKGLFEQLRKVDCDEAMCEAYYVGAFAGDIMRVIDNMMKTAQHSKGILTFRPEIRTIILSDWITPAIQPCSIIAASQGRDFDINTSNFMRESITTDPIKLRQILLNLYASAFMYSPPGNDTSLTMYPEQEDVILLLTCHGTIPEEHIPVLFEPYSADKEGFTVTGFGLYMGKVYAELLGGSLDIYNRDGTHFVFKLTLPRMVDL